MRPPSGETLVASSTVVILNGVDITSQAQITQGEKFNLEFLGMNLAKVAVDFDITNFSITAPYILLALISAFTQYGVTKIYSATNVATTPTEEKKKELPKDKEKGKGKGKEEEQDMGAAMAQSMQATNKLIPIFTFVLSLGYLGGASVLPTGVTLFWTAQNAFVIIQQSFMNRKQIGEKLKKRFQFGQTVSLKVKTDKNGSK
jgi:membrane protein insertase Oxa1/YidC/SpoIIIJ